MVRAPAIAALWLLALCACATEAPLAAGPPAADAAVPAAGPDGGAPTDAASTDAPTLSELVDTIFQPSCVLGRCHITQAPAGNLSFTGTRIAPYDALVNTPASGAPGRILVIPFDPEASYLIEKLTTDTPTAGTRMPPLGPLPETSVARIRAWIAAGALDE